LKTWGLALCFQGIGLKESVSALFPSTCQEAGKRSDTDSSDTDSHISGRSRSVMQPLKGLKKPLDIDPSEVQTV
jgi:hypothetical protein